MPHDRSHRGRVDSPREETMTAKSDLAQAVAIERTYNAPVEKVRKALTDVDQMRQWYFDLKEFKPEVGFEFSFVVEHKGNTYDHRCKITEVVPQKKIAYSWRYAGEEGDSLVTFELSPDGDKTRLKLTHEGLETFPKLPAYARTNFEQGWTEIVGSSLKQYVEESKKSCLPTYQIKYLSKSNVLLKRHATVSMQRGLIRRS